MRSSAWFATSLSAALLLTASCGPAPESDEAALAQPAGEQSFVSMPVPMELQTLSPVTTARNCDSDPTPGVMHCHAQRVTSGVAAQGFKPNALPSGLSPADIQSAYNLSGKISGGAGITVAIVDANDDPNAEADLAKYRSTYGLPPCTTANGCFKKVNQSGVQGSYPPADSGWAGEIALDIEMVSAACPNCKILLVEATSATTANLGKAVNTAVNLGANIISNSYGGSESSSDASTTSAYYNHPGVAIFASSGDSGYGVSYPAAATTVIAVGGTRLARSSTSRGWTESVWGTASASNGGAGSGCSKYAAKPSWQKDTGCGKRTVADLSAVADPASGVAVYDSYGSGGWAVYGGTSVASPVVSAIFALTGHTTVTPQFAYSNSSAFYDVTSGTNGSCGGSYLCTGGTGYDGPTGMGSPNGGLM